jgi:hypothetical protein
MKPRSLSATRGRMGTLLFAIGTGLVHILAALVAAVILLRPAPRAVVLYEITGTPLPLPSQMAWSLSLWLKSLLSLVTLAAPVVFVADAVLAGRLYRRSPRRAGWPWFWGVLALVAAFIALWLVAAILLPRRGL